MKFHKTDTGYYARLGSKTINICQTTDNGYNITFKAKHYGPFETLTAAKDFADSLRHASNIALI